MTASAVSSGVMYTKFTFALFEDTGWYVADYTGLDEMLWGKGKGCSFMDTCNTSVREFTPAN